MRDVHNEVTWPGVGVGNGEPEGDLPEFDDIEPALRAAKEK